MSRKNVFLIATAILALLSLAMAPWSFTGQGLADRVADHLRRSYGLEMTVGGRGTIALLPVPGIKLEDVDLAFSDKTLEAHGGILRGDLKILPFLRGEIELANVSLNGFRGVAAEALASEGGVSFLKALAKRSLPAHRLILTDTSFFWKGKRVENINLVVSWPDHDGSLDIAGSLDWAGERIDLTQVTLTPALIGANKSSPLLLNVRIAGTRIFLEGEAQFTADPRFTGKSMIEVASLQDIVRGTGFGLPLASFMPAFSVEGAFIADHRRLVWPSVSVALGADRLEGTLSLRWDSPRVSVSGTLASDVIDLSRFILPFAEARDAAGLWSNEPLSILGATTGDLDLRLSAAKTRIDRLTLSDFAANLLVRPGEIEASVGRASLNDGTAKGRLVLSQYPNGNGIEMKAQGSFTGVDASSTLADLHLSRWLSGTSRGQIAFEAKGQTAFELVTDMHGHATFSTQQGEIVGVSFADALKKAQSKPLSMALKGGRTAFENSTLHMNVAAGVAELSESTLTAPTLQATLSGQISLIERTLALHALVSPLKAGPTPTDGLDLAIAGPWSDLSVIPDAKSLIERSGAVKELLQPRRIPAQQPPVATAQ